MGKFPFEARTNKKAKKKKKEAKKP